MRMDTKRAKKVPKMKDQWEYTEFWDNPHREDKLFYYHEMALSMIPPGRGKCLDLGSAAGILTKEIEKKGYSVIASDADKRSLEKCKKLNLKTKKIDVEKDRFPFKDNTFDLVVCVELIEHIKSPKNLLSEIKRVLKPDGILIISTPNIGWWYLRVKHLIGKWGFHDPDHIRFYTPYLLEECLNSFGFEVVQAKSRFVVPKVLEFISPAFHNTSYSFTFKCKKK